MAFVAEFGTLNFHLKTKFDMENKNSINHENGNDDNRLLSAVYCQIMKPKDILHEEQKKFFAEREAYKEKHSIRDAEGNIIEEAIMPHKGFNFSMSYDALERAMERYAEQKISEWRSLNG